MVEVTCANCNTSFMKLKCDKDQQVSRGYLNSYCNRSCRSKAHISRIRELSGNRRDELTPLRWYMARVRYRASRTSRCPIDFNITLEYVAKLWRDQQGKCPITGWRLKLYQSTKGGSVSPDSASLDRIDSSLGYIEGNVRFVALMANHAKNVFTDEELIKFCRAVVQQQE